MMIHRAAFILNFLRAFDDILISFDQFCICLRYATIKRIKARGYQCLQQRESLG